METEYKTPPEKFAAFLKRQRMVFIVAFLQSQLEKGVTLGAFGGR